jgi:peptidoglycan hydrolase-like protein with peptidoglycan-binding domain
MVDVGAPTLDAAPAAMPAPTAMPAPMPAPDAGPAAVPTLDISEYVRWVQQSLNTILGINLPINGVMGPETRSAIGRFQQSAGLPVDGIAGPPTAQALAAALSGQGAPPADGSDGQAPPDASAAPTGELSGPFWNERRMGARRADLANAAYIRWLQRALNQSLGIHLAEDGSNDAPTRSAIRSFQRRHGLTADGVVGPRTEQLLIAAGAAPPPAEAHLRN